MLKDLSLKPDGSGIAQYLLRTGLRGGSEFTENALQSLTNPLAYKLASAFLTDLPAAPESLQISKVLGNFMDADNAVPTVISTFALGSLSAALRRGHDLSAVDALTQNHKLLGSLFSEADVQEILKAPDARTRQALLREKWLAQSPGEITDRLKTYAETKPTPPAKAPKHNSRKSNSLKVQIPLQNQGQKRPPATTKNRRQPLHT